MNSMNDSGEFQEVESNHSAEIVLRFQGFGNLAPLSRQTALVIVMIQFLQTERICGGFFTLLRSVVVTLLLSLRHCVCCLFHTRNVAAQSQVRHASR